MGKEVQEYTQEYTIGLKTLIKDLGNADKSLNQQDKSNKTWENVIFLVGSTKAGKTTSLHYLSGKKLKQIQGKDGVKRISSIEPIGQQEGDNFLNRIGHDSWSQTLYPNIMTTEDCTIIDCPGFQQNRDQSKIPALYIIKETMKKIKNVHFILVIQQEIYDSVPYIVEAINGFRNIFIPQVQQEISQHLSILLTKHKTNQQKQCFFNSIGKMQISRGEESQYRFIQNAIKQKRIYQFTCQPPSHIQGQSLRKQISQLQKINIDSREILRSSYLLEEEQSSSFREYLLRIMSEIIKQLKVYAQAISYGLLLFQARLIEDQELFNKHKELLQKCLNNTGIKPDHLKQYGTRIQLNQLQTDQQQDFLQLINKTIQDYTYSLKNQPITAKTLNNFLLLRVQHMLQLSDKAMNALQQIKDNLEYIGKVLEISPDLIHKSEAQLESIEENNIVIRNLADIFMRQSFPEKVIQKIYQLIEDPQQYPQLVSLCNVGTSRHQNGGTTNDSILNRTPDTNFDRYQFHMNGVDFRAVKSRVLEDKVSQLFNLHLKQIMKLPRRTSKLEALLNKLFIDFRSKTLKVNSQLDSRQQKNILKEISFILQKCSEYQSAITMLLIAGDYQGIESLIHLGFNIPNATSPAFILFLADALSENLRDSLAIRCYNQLTSRAQSRQQLVHYESLLLQTVLDNYPLREKVFRQKSEDIQGKLILNYDYLNGDSSYKPPNFPILIQRVIALQNQYIQTDFKSNLQLFMKNNTRTIES